MKAISLSLILMSLCLSRGLSAEEPAVSVYQIIKPSLDTDSIMGVAEVILKVTNPTEKTFFVLGSGITDIPHIIETKKNGKWIPSPSRRCGTGMTMRKFLPHSSIVFDVWDAPLIEEDITFRVRVYLYTESDVWNFYKDPAKKPSPIPCPPTAMLKAIEFAFTGYPVTDIVRARAFYEGVLNLTPATIFEHEGTFWVEYEVGPHVLAINNNGGEMWKPSKDGGGVALEVEDFDSAIQWLREKKANFFMEPTETPVCHMALVTDPDGNTICIHKRKPGNH